MTGPGERQRLHAAAPGAANAGAAAADAGVVDAQPRIVVVSLAPPKKPAGPWLSVSALVFALPLIPCRLAVLLFVLARPALAQLHGRAELYLYLYLEPSCGPQSEYEHSVLCKLPLLVKGRDKLVGSRLRSLHCATSAASCGVKAISAPQ